MKRTAEILICLSILVITALTIFAPVSSEALAMFGLFVVCVVVAIKHGIMRAVVLFLKEMW
jgi:hypothetical protein